MSRLVSCCFGTHGKRRGWLISCAVFGLVLLAAGFLSEWTLRWVIYDAVRTNLVVDSFESQGYKRWHSTAAKGSIPFNWNFYAFNVTNPEEVLQGGIPNVVQLGPFAYRKYRQRFNVTFPEDGAKYRYKEWEYFELELDKCVSDPRRTNITTVNLALLCVKGQLGLNWWEQLGTAALASAAGSNLMYSVSIHDLIFGYDDHLLQMIHQLDPSIPGTFPGVQPNTTSMDDAAKLGFNEMWSGKSDLNKINQFTEWQGHVGYVNVWGDAESNKIRGSEGFQYHPFVNQDETLHAFVDTTMRSITATSNETTTISGLNLLRFRLSPRDMQSASEYPPNAGYYQFGPSGVINRTSSAEGAPLFLSQPHFLHADPWYRTRVHGMDPVEKLHGTFIDVEPHLGASLNAVERLQINVEMSPMILLYPNIAKSFLPMMWIEQVASISESPELAAKFSGEINAIVGLTQAMFWGGYVGGSVLLALTVVIGVVFEVRHRRARHHGLEIDSYSRLVNEESTTPGYGG